MIPFGTVKPGSTLIVDFNSFDSAGAAVTLTGLAATDVECYPDGSETQRASDNGVTLLATDGIDIDSITGFHGFSLSLADNSDAGFWAAGKSYTVVVASVTIDGQTVSFIAAKFRIGYRAAVLNTTIATLATQTSFTLTSGPAEDDALNGMWVVIHDVASAVQKSQAIILDYTGLTKTVTLAAAPTFTIAATDNISLMGPAPLQATVSGRTADVTSTGGVGIDWGNVENQNTSVNLSATTTNLVNTITNYTGNTPQTGDAFARLGAPAGASVSADILVIDNLVDDLESRVGTPSNLGGGATLAANLSDIEAQTDDIGVAGAGLTDLGGMSTTMKGQVQTEAEDALAAYHVVLVKTTIATLASQTSFTLTAGSADNDSYNGCLIVVEDAVTAAQKAVGVILDYTGATKTVTLLNDPAVFTMAASDVVTIIPDRALKPTVDNRTLDVTATGASGLDWGNVENKTTSNDLSATTISTSQVVATLTNAPSDSSGVTTLLTRASEARLAELDAANLPTDIATVDTVVDAIKVITDALGAVAAARLALSAAQIIPGTIDTTGFASTTTQFEADDITEATADHYNGRIVIFTSGALVGQATDITDYSLATGRGHFTVTALTEAAGNNDTFIIV